jgi:hypothetical protein
LHGEARHSSRLRNFTFADDENADRIADRREAVCIMKAVRPSNRLQLGNAARFGIDAGRRFVENENSRVSQQHAAERQKLALPNGQLGDTFLHLRFKPVRKFLSEALCAARRSSSAIAFILPK